MMMKMSNTQYEILQVKISKAVEIGSYAFPGSFQRIDAGGRVATIGAWIVTDVPDPFPKSGAWSLLSVGLNGLLWIRRKCKS